MLKDTIKALKQKDISFEITDDAKQFILEKGTNIKFGARPLRRLIQRKVEDTLAEEILTNKYHAGDTIVLDYKDGKLVFSKKGEEAKVEETAKAE